MNLFIVLRKEDGTAELVTPPLNDLILPGVTRDSVLALARNHASGKAPIAGLPSKFTVSERLITMKEIQAAGRKGDLLEVFGAGGYLLNSQSIDGLIRPLGTAAIVCPVERIGYLGEDIPVPVGEKGIGPIANGFLQEIVGRQIGAIPSEWSVLVSE